MKTVFKPRILFFGTPEFAAEVLQYFVQNGMNVIAVVSKPDKAVGRSKSLQPTPVKKIAEHYRLPVFQPEKVSLPEPSEILQAYQADIFVVVAYGEILRQHLLDMPKIACINLHASLLPKYRGAAPIQRCIIEGETESGVTVMHMVKQMDAGDMIAVTKVPIGPDMTYGELSHQLCQSGKELLLNAVNQLAEGTASRIPQNHSLATFAPKIELEDCKVSWNNPAHSIHNLIRGTNPEPGAWCDVYVKGELKRLRLFRSKLVETPIGLPGEILQWGKQLIIGCQSGSLEILELQLEGKKVMMARDFMAGMSQKISLNYIR